MKEKIKKNFVYILTFIFFCIVLSLAPITGDDWANYTVGEQGFKMVLSAAKGMYFSWEGRFISRIFIYIFTYYKFLFVICTSGLLTLIVYLANKIIGDVKNKIVYFLPLIVLLLLNVNSISQGYTWIAGSITYLYPSAIVLAYFYYLYRKKEFKFGKIEFLVLLFINVITPMFVENIGLAFVIGNVIWLIYNRKEKKSELIKFLIMTVFSGIFLGLMMASPGTASRVTYEPEFYSMPFITRMLSNIPNFIAYTFARNVIVLILMLWVILYTLKKQGVKIYWLLLFSVIPLLGIIQNIYLLVPFDIHFNSYIDFWGAFNVTNWYFIFYWAPFGLLFFYSIFKNIDEEKERNFLLFLTLVATLAVGSMTAAPVWDERVALFSEIIFLIVSLRILKNCFNPRFNKVIVAFLAILLVYFITMFTLIFFIQKDRDKDIENQLKDKNVSEIYVYDQFITYIWTRNPWGEYHAKVFKTFYGIDQDTKLILKRHKIENVIDDAIGGVIWKS
ncbi:MAG: hypothetical protein HFH45_04320 [Bacilli bacterium]|nr:hypothetical protein [Bacilli bacterium]